jgi:FMN-dependent NADH-azoreductase
MSRILRIDASARTANSHSRALADAFVAKWRLRDPRAEIAHRDLAATPVPQLDDATIEGFYTPPEKMDARLKAATALSDTLIAELRAADILLVSLPMYNFAIPAALKAWIDQVVRIGHTFAYDGANFTGLLPGKRAYVMLAYGVGGYLEGGPFAAADFAQPHLKTLLNFLGLADVAFVGVEATTADAATVAANVAKAHAQIDRLLAA